MRVESSGVTIIMQKHEPGQTLTQQQGDFHFCTTNRTKTVTVWSRNKQRRCKSSNCYKQSCGERPYWAEPVLLCWTCLCPAVLSWKSASPHTVTQHIKAFYHKTKPSFSCAAWFCLFMLSSVIISARSKLRQRNWPTGTINMSIRQRSVASFVSVVQSRSQDMTLCWKSENHWGSNSSLIVTVCQSTWHFFSCGCFFTISPTNCTRTSVCAERKTAFCWLLHIVGQLILTQS